jgi:hypothetical protein
MRNLDKFIHNFGTRNAGLVHVAKDMHARLETLFASWTAGHERGMSEMVELEA